jgi:hypothetical protein
VEVGEASFEIYTDSNARVPEKDTSAENPFYVGEHAAAPEPPRRRSKRNTVTIPGEGRVSIEEAVGREDGMLIMLYVTLDLGLLFDASTDISWQPWQEAIPEVF